MRDTLVKMVKRCTGGVQAGATDDQLYGVLGAHILSGEKRINELLGYLAEAQDHILSMVKYLDPDKYDELLSPCISNPAEVVKEAGVLKGLVMIPNVDHHIVLQDDGKMWVILKDGAFEFAVAPGDLAGLGVCLKMALPALGRAMIEAPHYLIPGLVSDEPLGVWAEIAQMIDEHKHELVVSYEVVVG